jgi:hypothetical protein
MTLLGIAAVLMLLGFCCMLAASFMKSEEEVDDMTNFGRTRIKKSAPRKRRARITARKKAA